MRKGIYIILIFSALIAISYLIVTKYQEGYGSFTRKEIGQKIDSLNGVYVYYNGGIGNVSGRNLAPDGYNLGLKYQCVEFVKRYYYERLSHSMPNSYGHAKDFFDPSLQDGQLNAERNLIQFTNPGSTKPKENDLLIFKGTVFNRYGHVAIISELKENKIEVIQQNVGSTSREEYSLEYKNNNFRIEHPGILGWLRKK
jgi:hypothetical protein